MSESKRGYLTVAESKAIAIAMGKDPKLNACVGDIRDPERKRAAEALANAIRQIKR